MSPKFSQVTELPGSHILPIQLERSYARYAFAASFCNGKDVLEVACGGGQGLGILAEYANRVIGGDYDQVNLEYSRETYRNKPQVTILQLDAHKLPFIDQSMDVILLYEAIYYLTDPEKFIQECKRILRPGGTLILSTANKNWSDFNPSPFSHDYFSVPELKVLFQKYQFETSFFAAFPDQTSSTAAKLRSFVKKTAVRLKLMPKTMRGKVLLKRIFFGGLTNMPRELTKGSVPYTEPVSIPDDQLDCIHTTIFAVGQKKS